MARFGANLTEGMQFSRPRLPEETVPRVRPKPHDAGKSSFQIAKFHRAHQRGEVSAERAQGGAILRARLERRDHEDRSSGERRGYCLRECRRSTFRYGRAHRISIGAGLHWVSSQRRSSCFGFALRFLQVSAKLIPHCGQEFVGEVGLTARTESLVQRGREHRGWHGLVDCSFYRPAPFTRVGDPAGKLRKTRVSKESARCQIEQPRGDYATSTPNLRDVWQVHVELIVL